MSQGHTRREILRTTSATAGAAGLASLAGCTSFLGGGGGSVAVGSKKFTEQELLGYMSLLSLQENTDLDVQNEVSLGGTTTNFKALQNDQIDTYWEYTGTAWATLPPKHEKVITDPQEIYNKVDEEFRNEHDLDFLQRAPFNNTYVLTANPNWVEKTGITTISGFAEYIKSGNTDITVAMNAEFQNRPDGWPGLAKHYGFNDVRKELNVKNIGSGLVYQVVGEGEASIGMGFNTNPKILKFDLEVLKDDKRFFPVYNPAPLVRMDALDENPAMKEPLNAIGPKLSTDKIRNLNRRVSIGGEDAEKVARDFLTNAGVI